MVSEWSRARAWSKLSSANSLLSICRGAEGKKSVRLTFKNSSLKTRTSMRGLTLWFTNKWLWINSIIYSASNSTSGLAKTLRSTERFEVMWKWCESDCEAIEYRGWGRRDRPERRSGIQRPYTASSLPSAPVCRSLKPLLQQLWCLSCASQRLWGLSDHHGCKIEARSQLSSWSKLLQ